MKSEQDVLSIVEELKKCYPDAVCSLDYQKPHELLFATRLAAQCTDERVNKVTPGLYGRFPTLEALANADISEVEELIHSTGFFRAKARDIVAASRMLLDEYGGVVPDTMEDLLRLPGVGRKTANLILGDVYHKPGVVVADTHCIRLSGRLGLTDGSKDPVKVEKQLREVLPPEESNDFCTGWCSTDGQSAWPGDPRAPTAPCAPGAISTPAPEFPVTARILAVKQGPGLLQHFQNLLLQPGDDPLLQP